MWAEALLLAQLLLDLSGRFDRFLQVQQETAEAQQETTRLTVACSPTPSKGASGIWKADSTDAPSEPRPWPDH